MQVMETIFSQQSLFDKLLMVGEKKMSPVGLDEN